jgi:Na+/proline symporter
MTLSILDWSIIFVHLLLLVIVGTRFGKAASKGIESYFLGDRGLPWWAIAASGMASNLDLSGTMLCVAMITILGTYGFYIEIGGGVVIILSFLFVYMAKWLRRTGVMSSAELIQLRFGTDRWAKIAHIMRTISLFITGIGGCTFFLVGTGKFLAMILGVPDMLGLPARFWAAMIIVVLAMAYTLMSGLRGVVWTDVFQGGIIFITVMVTIGIVLVKYNVPETFQISLPLKDGGFMDWTIERSNWIRLSLRDSLGFPENSTYSIYNAFMLVMGFQAIRWIFFGLQNPGNYMDQRFFATKNSREASLSAFAWCVLFAFRWPFVTSLAIIGIVYGMEHGVIQDPELVLPTVIANVFPIGVKGLLVACLMSAAMSTFDSVVNAYSTYWVKDVYKTYIKPDTPQRKLVWQARAFSVVFVILGLFLSLKVQDIRDIWWWMAMALTAGLYVPSLMIWYWSKMNAVAYSVGIAIGIGGAVAQRLFFPFVPDYAAFITITPVAIIAVVVLSLLTKPVPREVTMKFYKKVRPWFWADHRKELSGEVQEKVKIEGKRDITAMFFSLPFQISWFFLWILLVMKAWTYFFVVLAILAVCCTGLYFIWFRNLHRLRDFETEEGDSTL